MKLAWLTDIHLNFLDEDGREGFYQDIAMTQCDGVLISGDIAEAPSLVALLTEMVVSIDRAIYFVLGNHDYYKGQVSKVREAMTKLTIAHEKLFWLPASGQKILDNDTILLGQDGWADGRLGDYTNTRLELNDSRMILDLFQKKILGKFAVLEKMQQLADADAMQLKNDLDQAVSRHPKKIIILTHVPPFRETCLYNGEISNDDWLPYFSSKATGDVLMQAAQANPTVKFLVLCGHTHGRAYFKPLDNLEVKVGQAEYNQPELQEIITL